MPRKTININPALDEKVVSYIGQYHMTYTSVITMALVKFFESQELQDKIKLAFPDFLLNVKDSKAKD
jgi:hypothetical protein